MGETPLSTESVIDSAEDTGAPRAGTRESAADPSLPAAHSGPMVEVHVIAQTKTRSTHQPGDPIGGVPVRLYTVDAREVDVANGATEADGTLVLEIPEALLGVDARRWTGVAGAVVDSNFTLAPAIVRQRDEPGDRRFILELRPSRGWTQRLLVDGHIEEGVRDPLRVWRWKGRRAPLGTQPVEERSFDHDRSVRVRRVEETVFDLQFTLDTSPCWILVNGGRHGTGALEIDPSTATYDRDAVLSVTINGSGIIRGVVLDGNGAPAPDISLMATWGPNADAPPSRPLRPELATRGMGQCVQSITTGRNGSFEITGLARGRFDISTPRRSDDAYVDRREHLGSATASPAPARTALQLRWPLIVVHVFGPENGPKRSVTLFDAGPVRSGPWIPEAAME